MIQALSYTYIVGAIVTAFCEKTKFLSLEVTTRRDLTYISDSPSQQSIQCLSIFIFLLYFFKIAQFILSFNSHFSTPDIYFILKINKQKQLSLSLN